MIMGLININLNGKYTLKCLKFLVFWVVIPILIITVYLILFQTEKLISLLKIIYDPITGSG